MADGHRPLLRVTYHGVEHMPRPSRPVGVQACRLSHSVIVLAVLGGLPGCERTRGPTGPDDVRTADASDTIAGEAESAATKTAEQRGPAFVLLRSNTSIVVPLSPDAPVVELQGLWAGALPPKRGAFGHGTITVVSAPSNDLGAIPICAWAEPDASCRLEIDRDLAPRENVDILGGDFEARYEADAKGKVTAVLYDDFAGTRCDCIVVEGISTDGLPEPMYDPDDPELLEELEMTPYETVEEYERECSPEALAPDLETTAYAGGVVYQNGMEHNGVCSGLNLYDGASATIELRPGAKEPNADFPARLCAADNLDEEAAEAGEECDNADEHLGYTIEAGQLVQHTGGIGTVGDECGCETSVPINAQTCPSTLDTCGTGKGFPAIEGAERWWAATDESSVVTLADDKLHLWSKGRAEPLRTLDFDDMSDPVIGVEFHADTVLTKISEVPTDIRLDFPALDAGDADFDGPAKHWGNLCFRHLQQEHLDAAEAACFMGLLAGGTDGTRGALTYNLGRIEQARGNETRALAYYQRSDALRPGNAAVKSRLEALQR